MPGVLLREANCLRVASIELVLRVLSNTLSTKSDRPSISNESSLD